MSEWSKCEKSERVHEESERVCEESENLILSSFVPLRYISTYWAYLICSFVGLLLNHDSLMATNAMSGLVPIVA